MGHPAVFRRAVRHGRRAGEDRWANSRQHAAITATGGNTLIATMIILGASMVISGFVNNIQYAATMAPIAAIWFRRCTTTSTPARRESHLLLEFTRKGIVVTTVSRGLPALYPWLRYFALS